MWEKYNLWKNRSFFDQLENAKFVFLFLISFVGLVSVSLFNGIWTFVGYLTPKPFSVVVLFNP